MNNLEREWYKQQIAKRERGVSFLLDIIMELKKKYNEDIFLNSSRKQELLRKHMGKKKSRGTSEFNTDQSPQIKKKFHIKDLIKIHPITENQQKYFNIYDETDKNVFIKGPAGTGKSLISLYKLLHDVIEKKYEKLVIIRSAVQSREIGFTPGTEYDKLAPYEMPYISICDSLFKYKNSYDNMKDIGMIEFHSSSFLRGCTFDNCAIFVDEVQSMTYHEIFTIMTRVGENSRIIISGDGKQSDLQGRYREDTCFYKLEKVLSKIDSVECMEFSVEDIVRSGFVKELIIADMSVE